jgi:hypothetical protein
MSANSHLALIPLLIGEFPRWLDYFAQHGPFKKPDQLAHHRKTIELRLGHTSAGGAIADPMFVESLYETLKAWGIGSRRSRLHPLQQFHAALLAAAPNVAALETLRVDAEALDVDNTVEALWKIIDTFKVVENDAQLVAGTKTLHHVLPDLVPSMDREYTQQFFRWHNPQFQYGQRKCFETAYAALILVARKVDARQYVGTDLWNTSVTKVLDNALVGLMCAIQNGTVR